MPQLNITQRKNINNCITPRWLFIHTAFVKHFWCCNTRFYHQRHQYITSHSYFLQLFPIIFTLVSIPCTLFPNTSHSGLYRHTPPHISKPLVQTALQPPKHNSCCRNFSTCSLSEYNHLKNTNNFKHCQLHI